MSIYINQGNLAGWASEVPRAGMCELLLLGLKCCNFCKFPFYNAVIAYSDLLSTDIGEVFSLINTIVT